MRADSLVLALGSMAAAWLASQVGLSHIAQFAADGTGETVSVQTAVEIAGLLLAGEGLGLAALWRAAQQGQKALISAKDAQIASQAGVIAHYESSSNSHQAQMVELLRGALAANTTALQTMSASLDELKGSMEEGRKIGREADRTIIEKLSQLLSGTPERRGT